MVAQASQASYDCFGRIANVCFVLLLNKVFTDDFWRGPTEDAQDLEIGQLMESVLDLYERA